MHVKFYCLRGEMGAASRGGTKLLRRGLQSKMWRQLRSDHIGPKLGDGIAKKDPSRCESTACQTFWERERFDHISTQTELCDHQPWKTVWQEANKAGCCLSSEAQQESGRGQWLFQSQLSK